MRVLICPRDSGDRELTEGLASLLPGFEIRYSSPGEPIGPLDGVDAVLVFGILIDRSAMERGEFGFIQALGTGYDNVDMAAAAELGVWVANLPASKTGNAESVAEHAILLMLALSRRLAEAEAGLRERRWARPVGKALLGKTACLVGLGDVGLALADRLQAFGIHLVATRRSLGKAGPSFVRLYPAEQLAEALREADYVVLCARARSDNTHLMDRHALAAMKPGAFLINVARGSLVDHDAVLAAIESGHLGGAGLDVFWEEPVNPEHPLFRMDQVIASPHIAGVTDVNVARSLQLTAENLQRYARGEVPRFLVNDPHQVRGRSSFVMRNKGERS